MCYIAAEALWHLLDKKPQPYVASYIDSDGLKATHWWLVDGKKKLDPTAEQYYNIDESPPYHLGRPCGFLTKEPSKRCMELMNML